jgi:hypothetical protein
VSARLSSLPARVVEKIDATGDCWLWTGSVGKSGYGRVWHEGRVTHAHRAVYELLNGPLDLSRDVDHACRNRPCVRPDHLRSTSRSENNQNRGGAQTNSRSGVRGVSWAAHAGRWRVTVTVSRRQVHGGYFGDLSAAELRARELRNQLFTHNDADRQDA